MDREIDEMKKELYLLGDCRYAESAHPVYIANGNKEGIKFLLALQSLMEEFGVVKIDVCIDPFK